jgi:hypothetical protein
MHADARAFVAEACRRWPPRGPVYEIGSRDINGGVRDLFAGLEYLGVDCAPGRGVDVVADALSYRPAWHPATIVCCEVLEHTAEAAGILSHAARLLEPGGRLFVTTAGPSRAPHSAVDGGRLRPGEYYAGISTNTLALWLVGAALEILELVAHGEDVYAAAERRP